MREWLCEKLGNFIDVDAYLNEQRFVTQSGRAVTSSEPYQPHTFVWFYRELRDEVEVPGKIALLHRDERIVVIDKPPFLATIPRGRHIVQSVVTRLRDRLQLPELSPAHRLDRITSGVLILTTEKRWRGAYQSLFQNRQVSRTYQALAKTLTSVEFPITIENHLHKIAGEHTVRVLPGKPPNAKSVIDIDEVLGDITRYRLFPKSGKTHQLRQHMLTLGAPILGDPLYPVDLRVPVDDFTTPLQLLAHETRFVDPVDHTERVYRSQRRFPLESLNENSHRTEISDSSFETFGSQLSQTKTK